MMAQSQPAHLGPASRSTVVLAPKPIDDARKNGNQDTQHFDNLMPFTCQTCTRRKVKCDKLKKLCSSCRKAGLECIYQAPPPRQRKRQRNAGDGDSSNLYKQTSERHSGPNSRGGNSIQQPSTTLSPALASQVTHQHDSPSTDPGKLVSRPNEIRWIASSLYKTLDDDDLHHSSDEETGADTSPDIVDLLPNDPLSAALLFATQRLYDLHPDIAVAQRLLKIYCERVDPLLKLMHCATTKQIVSNVFEDPRSASKAHECLTFSVYHAAIISLRDEECHEELGHSRAVLTAKYRHAVHQALVNAAWLRTADMAVLQALVLLLITIRFQSDPNTYWILTGTAIRIAQRMGLHRDSANAEMSPFDAEMRRRLFWHLLPLDGYAGGMSGTGISLPPNSWDTQKPMNIDDAQLWPDMETPPVPKIGATEMLFFLAKTELSDLYTRRGVNVAQDNSTRIKDGVEAERLIDEVESELELKYLRYCDIIDPVHTLALGMVRSAMNSARLQVRMPRLMNKTASDEDRMQLCALAQKVMDTLDFTFRNQETRKYLWLTRAFNLWPALACVLSSLSKVGFFSQAERDAAWRRLVNEFARNPEMLERKSALTSAIGRLTLQAWDVNPPSNSMPEPDFILAIRDSRKRRVNHSAVVNGNASGTATTETTTVIGDASSSDDIMFTTSDHYGMVDPLSDELNLGEVDWKFWDNLMREHQTLQYE